MKSVKQKINQNFREILKPLEKMPQLLKPQTQRKAEQPVERLQQPQRQGLPERLLQLQRPPEQNFREIPKPIQTRRLTQKPRLSVIRKSRMLYSGKKFSSAELKKFEDSRIEARKFYEENYPLLKDVFYTLDNGSKPFRVTLINNVAQIDMDTNLTNPKFKYDVLKPNWRTFTFIPFIKVFIGNDNEVNKGNPQFFGNSILLQKAPGQYVYIGNVVYEFNSDDIYVFESPVGGSDVSYPYAYTKNRTLLFWEFISFPTMYGKIPEDVHYEYIKKGKYNIKPIDGKIIQRRLNLF